MSHHLDALLARRDARLTITNLYVFRGKEGTVFVLNTNSSLAGADASQGFHPDGQYTIKLDLDGDAVEELTYRVTFGPRDTNGSQTVEIRRLSGREARDPSSAGTVTLSGVTGEMLHGAAGMRHWAGRAADPFYIDAALLRAVAAAFRNGTRVDLSRWRPAKARNHFAGATVQAIVLEVPDTELTWRLREVPVEVLDGEFTRRLQPNKRINVWATTQLATAAGGWQSISRVGHPMMQPIFALDEREEANRFNTIAPADDMALFGERLARSVANVVAAHDTSSDPQAYGEMVAALLLPDMLPYQLGSPAFYSFAGHNGRALTDNAPDVMFSLITNTALNGGLTVQRMPSVLRDVFPYLAPAED